MRQLIGAIGRSTFIVLSIGMTSLAIFTGPGSVLDGAVLRPVEEELSAPSQLQEPPRVATGPPGLTGPSHLFTTSDGPSENGLPFLPVYSHHYQVESFLSPPGLPDAGLRLFASSGLGFPLVPIALDDDDNDGGFVLGSVTKRDGNGGPAPIPEPASSVLFGVGLFIVGRALKSQLS